MRVTLEIEGVNDETIELIEAILTIKGFHSLSGRGSPKEVFYSWTKYPFNN